MATNTAAVLPPARQPHRQVPSTLKQVINWNDAGVANGVPMDNSLPAGATILDVLVQIVTPFNGTTPILTVGTVSTAYNNIVAAADVDETVAGTTRVTRGVGNLLASAADTPVYTKLALTAASAGQAIITIVYECGVSPS
jgi:hypothetical protein